MHQHPVPRADLAGPVRGVLERLAGDRRRPGGGGGELAVPAGQGAVARDPDPAVRAGHRHPQRGAQGAGRAAAGVVRRALDHLGLRPVRGERPLLPGAAADHRRRGPARGARGRRHPKLAELRLHNGTIYRWNRPVYDVAGGVPHLRVENRLLAAGPTVADTMANAAFYFGLVRALAESERPLWSQMSFSAAEENFHVAARQGIDAQIYWPGVGQVPRHRAGAAAAAAAGAPGAGGVGRLRRGQRDRLLGHHRAALPDRRRTARSGSSSGWRCGGRPGPLRRAAGDAAGVPRRGCTPTSPSTPGTDGCSGCRLWRVSGTRCRRTSNKSDIAVGAAWPGLVLPPSGCQQPRHRIGEPDRARAPAPTRREL